MKPGLLPIVAAGLTSLMLRALGAESLADASAMAYLVAATVAFSPRWSLAAQQNPAARNR
jgi:hypothetical protein